MISLCQKTGPSYVGNPGADTHFFSFSPVFFLYPFLTSLTPNFLLLHLPQTLLTGQISEFTSEPFDIFWSKLCWHLGELSQLNLCSIIRLTHVFSMRMGSLTPVLIPNTPNRDLSRAGAQKILLRYKT